MSFAKRLFYYLGGFALGTVILLFFFSGKRTSCDYGPNDRTLKHLRTKPLIVSNTMDFELINPDLVNRILSNGSVLFNESNIGLDSVNTYQIEFTDDQLGPLKASFVNHKDSLVLKNISFHPAY